MIKTLNPYSSSAKTAEIMSRYKPIAPKPEVQANSSSDQNPCSISQKIQQSPYLRDLWPQLQARPTRTRKRGRSSSISSTTFKRPRNQVPSQFTSSCARNIVLPSFPSGIPHISIPKLGLDGPTTLPFLRCPSSVPIDFMKSTCHEEEVINLNTSKDDINIPEEKDLLQQLQGPVSPATANVIIPQPVRPVGSSIYVGCISENLNLNLFVQAPKKPEEVEKEVECETLPAIVSDSNNKVKMANSAYKEMVGQPKCSWLDSMVVGNGGQVREGTSMRISGEVMLHISDSRVVSSKGFSCWVKIEWGSDGRKRSVNAFCDVNRLYCQSRDYVFKWRFHTQPRGFSIQL